MEMIIAVVMLCSEQKCSEQSNTAVTERISGSISGGISCELMLNSKKKCIECHLLCLLKELKCHCPS